MADLDRIKRNVSKMVAQSAPEAEIDDYLGSEGVTPATIRAHKSKSASVKDDADFAEKMGAGGMPLRLADSLSLGAFTPVSSAIGAAGKTVGKALTGQPTDFAGDYTRERDTQDELLRRSREGGGLPGHAAEIALSLPFMGGKAAAGAVADGLAAAAPAARSTFQRFVTDPAKAGAAYGAVYGANSARGGIAEHAEGAAGGAAAGAVLGPALHGGLYALGSVPGVANQGWRAVTGRSPGAVAENARMAAEIEAAGVTPTGQLLADQSAGGFVSRGLANSMVGGRVRGGAEGTIGEIEGAAQNALARHTEGRPVNDLADGLQTTLRQKLAEHSIPSNLVNRMPELDGIAGRMGEAGFAPPPPSVQPIPPRPVSPVRAAEVNPDQVPFEAVMPRPVKRGAVSPTYPKHEDIQPQARFVQESEALQREHAALSAEAQSSAERFRQLAAKTGRDPAEVEAWASTQVGRQGLPRDVAAAYEEALSAQAAASAMNRKLEVSRRAIDLDRDKAWRESVRNAHTKAEHDVESAYMREQQAASRESADATQTARAKAIRDAQMKAESDAAAETARLRSEASAEAQDATERARQKAMSEYNSRAQNEVGFKPGQSRESYPTEFAAAYEQAARVTPDYRMNPMGGATPEGRAAKTATKSIVNDLAEEANRRLHLKGKAFDENGTVTPEFEKYLKDRLGGEIGHRIAELTRTRAGHDATTPRGLKELRTEIRNAAERAEHPNHPEMPRTAEAAALRRLHGALTEDMGRFAKDSGGPAPRFNTETMPAEYVGPQSTRIGNMPPSDVTVYVKPEHLDRLTGSRMPNDVKGALPANRSYEVQGNSIAVRRNDAGEIDKATRVPFSSRPEVGLRPVQMWKDSNGIHYGSPITSRAQSPGEHGAAIMSAVDRAYGKHFDEMREPLRKVFGDKIEPIKAMDRLVKAANDGDLHTLRPFMRVLTEKAEPMKGVAAILTHATNGARTMDDLVKGYRGLSKDALDVMMTSGEGQSLRRQLDKLVSLAETMTPYAKSIDRAKQGGVRVEHLPAVGAIAMGHALPLIAVYGGAAATSRFLSSPRYVRWLTEAARVRTPPELQKHVAKLAFMTGRDTEAGADIHKAASRMLSATLGIKPANAMFIGEGAAGDDPALAEAKQAHADGKAPDAIWKQHGWALFPDGKWRGEEPDDQSEVTPEGEQLLKTARGGTVKLELVLNHPALFERYPDLKEMPVAISRKMPGFAQYKTADGHIELSPKAFGNNQQLKGLILHEVQHAIAQREGFAYGRPGEAIGPDYFSRPGEVEAFNTQFNRDMTGPDRRASPPWSRRIWSKPGSHVRDPDWSGAEPLAPRAAAGDRR